MNLKIALAASIVFTFALLWVSEAALANRLIMCAPFETTMKFGGYYGHKSIQNMTLIIRDHNIRKCVGFGHKAEPPRYEMVIDYWGRRYPIPEPCVANFVFDYDTTYVDPLRKGRRILLRGQSYPEGEVEERLLALRSVEAKSEFEVGSNYRVTCALWCRGEDCRPIH